MDPSHNPGSEADPVCPTASFPIADVYIDAAVVDPDIWELQDDGFQRCKDTKWAISVKVDLEHWGFQDFATLRVEPSGWARWFAYGDRMDGGDQPWRSTWACASEAMAEIGSSAQYGREDVYKAQYYCHAFGSVGVPGTGKWAGGATWDLEGWRTANWSKMAWVTTRCTW